MLVHQCDKLVLVKLWLQKKTVLAKRYKIGRLVYENITPRRAYFSLFYHKTVTTLQLQGFQF